MDIENNQKLAIVIPIYKTTLSEYEKISIDRCFEVLSNYDIYFILPHHLDIDFYKENYKNYKQISFNDEYFKNIDGYNKLMLSSFFYESFFEYKYLLIYQTDAFVFEDNIKYWIDKDYDYIGGIWFQDYLYPKNESDIWLAGNGGLSLRKVKSFIEITKSRKMIENLYTVLIKIITRKYPIRDIVKLLGIRNNIKWFIENYKNNEDSLFAVEIPKLVESFSICPVHEALLFSYDRSPKFLHEYNNFILPFGCHAWYREDSVYKGNLEFWSEIIEIDK